MDVATAEDAAKALVSALNVRWGELTIQVVDGEVTVLRSAHTLKPAELADLGVPSDR